MSGQAAPSMTYAEYVAYVAKADVKHEYVNGKALPITASTRRHSLISANLIALLGNALLSRRCQVFESNLRLHVPSTKGGFFPDVMVVCGEFLSAKEDPEAVTNPLLIIEVLSEGTEGFDRGAKAAHYRRIDTLREYILVSQTERVIEVQRPTTNSRWELEHYTARPLVLSSLGVELSLDDIYRDPLSSSPETSNA